MTLPLRRPDGGPVCSVRPHMTPQESDRPDRCSGRRSLVLRSGIRLCPHCDTAPHRDPSVARQGPPNAGTVSS